MPQLEEILTEELKDIYDAEKQIVKALPRLAKYATSAELKQGMQAHLEQTKNQVTRLEQCFEMLEKKARSKPCRAMKGLIEEGMEHAQEHSKGSDLDCILIGSLQKVEHYEIAAYGTARAIAKSAGHRDVATLLDETLKEEGETDKLLTKVALTIQKELVQQERQEAAGKKMPAVKSSGRNGSATRNGGSQSGSKVTINHNQIREWAEARGAHPACVKGTGGRGDTGMIRLDFPGYTGADSLEEITWDDFFQKFDEQGLALLYQDATSKGRKSNFNKLIARETAALTATGSRGSARAGRR